MPLVVATADLMFMKMFDILWIWYGSEEWIWHGSEENNDDFVYGIFN